MRKSKYVLVFLASATWLFSGCNQWFETSNDDPLLSDTSMSLVIKEWSKRIAKYPKNDEYRYKRGLELASNRKFKLAIKDYDKAIELNPTSDYFIARAEALMGLNETKQALEDYNKAVELDPKNEEALLKLGQFYLFVRQFENSTNVLKKLEQTNPSSVDAQFYQGMVAKESGDTTEAIKAFQRAVQLDLLHYNSLIQLGQLYSERKDPVGLSYFRNATIADEFSDEARYGLGLLYQRLGNYDSAVVEYQKTIDLNAQHYFAYYNTGYIMFSQNNWDRAIEHFRIAIKFAPEFAKAHYMLGLSNEGKGNPDQAAVHYERCLQADPNFEAAKQRLEIVK